MENEQLPAPAPASSAGGTAPTPASTAATRPPGPQISVYSGIPDRQTVQVIQQALHRQPNTAAQYLQQMYAAQQQHLMLQTAALQQQHLTSAQLQSLAAVQQVWAPRGHWGLLRPGAPLTFTPHPSPDALFQINLATSPAAAQLLNRAQSVGPGASGIAQQAVLLGNTASPALTASQAQMYLRAQMGGHSGCAPPDMVSCAPTLPVPSSSSRPRAPSALSGPRAPRQPLHRPHHPLRHPPPLR
uniref:Uncharacterized protein n=1 Tax=Corvus moneduloides TaxID=1196302 RepID=A0A8U7P1R4_CORMO